MSLHNDDDTAALEAQVAADAAAAAARGDLIEDTTTQDDDDAEKAAAKAAEEAAAAAKTADELANAGEAGETDEEKAEREAEEAAAEKSKRTRIPLSRHEEILNKAREREAALTRRLEEVTQAARADKEPPRNALADLKAKINEQQDKYEELVFDGKKDEAKALRKELDAMRDQYTDAKTAAVGDMARRQTIDDLKYETTLAKAEADYPALNPDNVDTFEAAKADEVAALMGMFQKNGLTRQASLEKAVRYVMGAPAQKQEAGKDDAAATLAAARAKAAREKAVETQKKQPPDATITGTDNDKAGKRNQGGVDIMKLSQEQFAKLDEEALARMRGDEVG